MDYLFYTYGINRFPFMIHRKYILFYTANIIMSFVSINKLRRVLICITIRNAFGFVELSFYIYKSSEKNTSNIIPAISSISYTSYFILFDNVRCNVFTCFLIYLMLLFVFSLTSSELLNEFFNFSFSPYGIFEA